MLSVVLAIVIIFVGKYLYETFSTTYGLWSINWQFKTPRPVKIYSVFERYGVGDGEAYYICEYDEKGFQKVKKNNQWNRIADGCYEMVLNKIAGFKSSVLQIHLDKKAYYSKLFLDNPIEFDKNSQYYLYSKGEGGYFLAVLNEEKRKIYILEWAF